MDESDADRQQARARQVTADAHERRHQELHLMAVGVPRHADIADPDAEIGIPPALHLHALVGDGAVAFGRARASPSVAEEARM